MKLYKLRPYAAGIIALLVMSSLVVPFGTIHAEDNDKKDKKELQAERKEQRAAVAASILDALLAPPAETTPAPASDTVAPADAIPATPAAATPAAQAPASTTPATPKHGDPINQNIEDVLNTTIPPKETPKKETAKATTTIPATTKPTNTPKTPAVTGTPIVKEVPAVQDVISNTVQSAIDSLTGAQTTNYASSNYYSPLDRLSPQVTYALSFIAMIIGISGAALIIKNPRGREVWMPQPSRLAPQELLET